MIVYGLKTCDTCRKACAALAAAGHAPVLVDMRAEPVPPETLARFHAAFGEALVNRRSTTWRSLDAATQTGEALPLLAAHPALMKRPVIAAGGSLYLGWGPEVQAALL